MPKVRMERRNEEKAALAVDFPGATAMLVSPTLSVDLAPYPFLCLDVDAGGREVTGRAGVSGPGRRAGRGAAVGRHTGGAL